MRISSLSRTGTWVGRIGSCRPDLLSGHPVNQYRFWFAAKDHTGWDALFVNDTRYLQGYERYLPLFDTVDPKPDRIRVFRNGQLARVLNVFRCYGFKGKFEGE